MARHQKLLDRLLSQPPPASFRWEELVNVLRGFGYELLSNSGSRRKFYHKERDKVIICHEPHPAPNVDKGAIRDVVEHLRENGFI